MVVGVTGHRSHGTDLRAHFLESPTDHRPVWAVGLDSLFPELPRSLWEFRFQSSVSRPDSRRDIQPIPKRSQKPAHDVAEAECDDDRNQRFGLHVPILPKGRGAFG